MRNIKTYQNLTVGNIVINWYWARNYHIILQNIDTINIVPELELLFTC